MLQHSPSSWDSIRRGIYQRDNYQCQNCGSRAGPESNIELHVHHTIPLNEGGLNTTSNLFTLCKRCRNAVHAQERIATGIENRGSIAHQAIEQVGKAIGTCEVCGSDDFGHEADDIVRCMNCDWIYQLEETYISDVVTETFKTCPGWFCNNSDMEYKPFHFNEGKSGQIQCKEGCGKTWRVDPKTGAYERYSPNNANRNELTRKGNWRESQRGRSLWKGLLDVWNELKSGRS